MWYYPTQLYLDAIIVNDQTYRIKLVDLIQEQEEFEVELEFPSQKDRFIERHCIHDSSKQFLYDLVYQQP